MKEWGSVSPRWGSRSEGPPVGLATQSHVRTWAPLFSELPDCSPPALLCQSCSLWNLWTGIPRCFEFCLSSDPLESLQETEMQGRVCNSPKSAV